MKLNKIFSIILGLSLLGVTISFAQNEPTSGSWKTYEAANGDKFRADIAHIQHSPLGLMVWEEKVGVGPAAQPQPMAFDCHGHYTVWTGTVGWLKASPGSIPGQIAKDVCAKR